MTLEDFEESLSANEPPVELTPVLASLWWDARGDWARAHLCVQQAKGNDGSWVHAYLHRKEGDRANATGWYSRAGKPFCEQPPKEEWLGIVRELLGAGDNAVARSAASRSCTPRPGPGKRA
jgi:hypothetical protein